MNWMGSCKLLDGAGAVQIVAGSDDHVGKSLLLIKVVINDGIFGVEGSVVSVEDQRVGEIEPQRSISNTPAVDGVVPPVGVGKIKTSLKSIVVNIVQWRRRDGPANLGYKLVIVFIKTVDGNIMPISGWVARTSVSVADDTSLLEFGSVGSTSEFGITKIGSGVLCAEPILAVARFGGRLGFDNHTITLANADR